MALPIKIAYSEIRQQQMLKKSQVSQFRKDSMKILKLRQRPIFNRSGLVMSGVLKE
jgi:hypothetical protein